MKHRILASLIAMSSLVAFSPVFASSINDEASNTSVSRVSGNQASGNEMLAQNPLAKDTVNIAIGASSPGHRLPFSDDQLEKLSVIKSKFMDEAGPKATELRSLSRQLRTCLAQETVDVKQARELQEKINQKKADLANLKLQMRLDTMGILTAEQKKELHHRMLQKLALGGGKGFAGKHGCHGRGAHGRPNFRHKYGSQNKPGAGSQFKRSNSPTTSDSLSS